MRARLPSKGLICAPWPWSSGEAPGKVKGSRPLRSKNRCTSAGFSLRSSFKAGQ